MIKKVFCLALIILIMLSALMGCAPACSNVSIFAMDTVMTITVYGKDAEKATEEITEEIYRLDELLSTAKATSEVYSINSNNGGDCSEDTMILLEKSLEYYEKTDDLFDITVYPIMEAWGFTDSNYTIPDESELEQLRPLVGSDKINISESSVSFDIEGMKIDFGGIAKGYASFKATEILEKYNITSATLSLGGNVQVVGKKNNSSDWKIGIVDPFSNDNYYGTLELSDKSVITSGDYQRYFEEDGIRYHHIIDTSTLSPSTSGVKSVTIVPDDPIMGDCLSTSLFVMGLDKATEYWKSSKDNFDFVMILSDGSLYITENLQASFSSVHEFNILSK